MFKFLTPSLIFWVFNYTKIVEVFIWEKRTTLGGLKNQFYGKKPQTNKQTLPPSSPNNYNKNYRYKYVGKLEPELVTWILLMKILLYFYFYLEQIWKALEISEKRDPCQLGIYKEQHFIVFTQLSFSLLNYVYRQIYLEYFL